MRSSLLRFRRSATLVGLASLSGCVTAPGATLAQLQLRAQYDLHCPAGYLQMYRLDDRTQLVQGCEQQLIYLESCQHIRGAPRCTWQVDSPTWRWTPPAARPEPPAMAATRLPGARPPSHVPFVAGGGEVGAVVDEEGLLNVASEGGFCEVSIDGRSHGLTPVGGIHLPEGPAVVSCRGRHRTLERQIEVTPGQRLRVSFDLVSGSSREVPPAVDWGF